MANGKSITVLSDTVRNWHESVNGPNLRCGHYLVLLLLIPTLTSLLHVCDAQNNITTDTQALLAFKSAADPAGVLRSWDTASQSNPCNTSAGNSWQGIACNTETVRVDTVDVHGLGLSGTFDNNTLGNLDALRYLVVGNNNFQGPSIPEDIGNIPRLQQLWAQNAQLSGSFPKFLTTSKQLKRLSLSGNNFSGPIPNLTALTTLVSLDLSSNSFWGTIPTLPPIVVNVSLSHNNLSGNIPLSLPSTLKTLDLSSNLLSGPIPSNLGNFSNSSFDGNSGLCGPPTSNQCLVSLAPGPATAPGPAPDPASSGEHKKRHFSTKAIIVIVVVDVVGLALIVGGLLIFFANTALIKKIFTPKDAAPEEITVKASSPAAALPPPGGAITEAEKGELIFVDDAAYKFELEQLLRASAEILGKGSLGTTYRARLDSGNMVAVKRLKDVKEMPQKDFEKRMDVLGHLRHPHLLPLRAYYYAKEEKLLVYDYMDNGSLASVLHGPKVDAAGDVSIQDQRPRNIFDWDSRLKVAYDVAQALSFLHGKCPPRMFPHQNLKSSNVILGINYEAYLADFCLVPLIPPRIAAQGMTGYAAPEYNRTKKRSEKADVYSFGVLLLELLTGRRPAHLSDPEGIDLPKFVKAAVREEWTVEVFDLQLKTSRDGDAEMVTVLQIAMRCVDDDPDQRPTIPQVLAIFENMKQAKDSYQESASGDISSAQFDGRDHFPADSASFSR